MMNKKNKFLTSFTLTELLIVISVITILVAIALPRLKGMKDEASVARAKADLANLQLAVESYYVTYGAYPLDSGGSCWSQNECPFPSDILLDARPQILNEALADPFGYRTGDPYQYDLSPNGQYYVIFSYGFYRAFERIEDSGRVVHYGRNGTGDFVETTIYVSNSEQDRTGP